jgi:RNA-directed DNA polymerase
VDKTVLKLQKRIYQAKRKGNQKLVKSLQRLLTNSRSAKALAVRKVTQENKGKKTAGVDGRKSLTPKQRVKMLQEIKISERTKPLRRVYIPKSNEEKRPISIPTIEDRATQMLLKLALEPEWEAVFEPNSYGFRPARSAHDAIEAILKHIHKKQKWVLDADISKCFDKIDHQYLINKLGDCLISYKRQIKAWLKSGYMEDRQLFPTQDGTPQGGVISPLLANITLHGIEAHLKEWVLTQPYKGKKRDSKRSLLLARYADDFVCLHESKEIVENAKKEIERFLEPIGLKCNSQNKI